ncbi:MAG: glycoside hydrolase family 88 protein [Bacteroidales bacterium]|nr:glycoside hydrolase family 88 protein [Bacteroidales bacterium]
MRLSISIITALALAACTAKAPLSSIVVVSEIERNPEAAYIDGLGGKLKWNYTTGLELKAFLDVAEAYAASAAIEPEVILQYVDAWYDAIIAEDGTIGVNYKKSNYSVDHICPGRTLFQLYRLTGKEKYRLAMDKLYEQVKEQPRTPEGGFWHKQIYPEQMWLDGLYMMQPFYAEYTAGFVPDKEESANFEDIVHQFLLVAEHTHDPYTGLYRHAWDSSHEMFWAEKATGRSAHAWGRAMGWYAMALVDVLPFIPANIKGREGMVSILRDIADNLPKYADPGTGMWYQVLDQPGREGNYVEATASAMFVYAMLKGCRYGYLDCLPYAKECYLKLLDTFVTYDENGLLDLNDCCEVAGLGGKQMRSGDYEYYIHEPVRANDPKGIGPLIWAALEYERL